MGAILIWESPEIPPFVFPRPALTHLHRPTRMMRGGEKQKVGMGGGGFYKQVTPTGPLTGLTAPTRFVPFNAALQL